MAWNGESRRHSLARKGVKTAKGKAKQCDVANPMNTRSNKELLYGHSLTHTKNYQKSVGIDNARCEHDRLVAKMKERGMEHNSPFKSKLTKTEERKVEQKINPFRLFDEPERDKATKEIKKAIKSGDPNKVIQATEDWGDLGAGDTASREAITDEYNKKHPKNKFDYGLWYR